MSGPTARSAHDDEAAPPRNGSDWDKNQFQRWDKWIPTLDMSLADRLAFPISTSRYLPLRPFRPWRKMADQPLEKIGSPRRHENLGAGVQSDRLYHPAKS